MMGKESLLESLRAKTRGMDRFLSDAAEGMVLPLIPLFASALLGAPALLVGLAESVPALLSALATLLPPALKKSRPFRACALILSAAMRPLISSSTTFAEFLPLRSMDSAASGSAFPGSKLTESPQKTISSRMKNYGGLLLGPILALLLIFLFSSTPEPGDLVRSIILLSAIPASLALIPSLIKKEPKYASETSRENSPAFPKAKPLPPAFPLSLLFLASRAGLFIFLLKASASLPLPFIIFSYILFLSAHAALSTPAQLLLASLGQRKTFIAGCIIFAMAALSFSLPLDAHATLFLFALLGASSAAIDAANRGEALPLAGKYPIPAAMALLAANIIAGLSWDITFAGMHAPFLLSCALSLLSTFAFALCTTDE